MKAFISGITGQTGSYLAELLLEKGYKVHGLVRRASSPNTHRIKHILDRVTLHYGDLSDGTNLCRLLGNICPDEIYNLGAMSHVKVSFEVPEYTADVTGTGSVRLLEAIRAVVPKARYYQASSSEMFGGMECPPCGYTELSPFHPRSPYGCAKVFAHHLTVNYRESYDLHASCGILFNHESPRRGETFVTRKITRAIARIKAGRQDILELGNLDAKRDWGYAPEYAEAIWQMLQQPEPGDYVIATGRTFSVRDFVYCAFDYAGLNWQDHVRINPKFFRPAEVEFLLGDPSKALKKFGWEPNVSFHKLVETMVDADEDELRSNSGH